MAKVKGVCHNYDNCDMAADKVVQEVEKTNFVCEECGKPLYPVEDKGGAKNPNQKRLITLISLIVGVIVVVGGIVCGIIFGMKSSREKAERIRLEAIEQARLDSIAKVEADSLAAIKLAEEQAAEAARLAKEQAKQEKKQSVTTGSIDYGKWSGSWKNGKPNGTGTMRYTKEHLIDPRDPQKRVAQKGDYIIGEFVNGKLVQGKWYDSSNNIKGSIIIGM